MRMTEPFMHIRLGSRQNKYKMAIRVSEYPATELHYAYSIYSYTIYHRTMDADTHVPTTFARPPIFIKRTEVDSRPKIFHAHNFN
jgi:hypothetical protein